MTTATWDGGGGADTNWSNPANWSNDTLPGSGDDVVISIPATVNFTSAAGTVSIKSLTSDDAINVTGGTLGVTGTATLHQPLTITGGTIQGGTWDATGTTITISNATLDGVTLKSDVTATSTVTIKNGLTFNNAKLNLSSVTIVPTGTLTLGGTGEIVFGGAGFNRILTSGGTTTIGANVTIHGTQSGLIDNAANGDQILNLGTIKADTSGATITVNMNGVGALFTNQGHLAALNGGTMTINGNWTDSGLINEVNSTFNFGGTFTSDFTGLTRTAGTVNITGTLTNTGKTFALNATTGSMVVLGGTILGGTFTATGGATLSTSGSATLDGVTLNSDVTATGTTTIKDGLTFNNAIFFISNATVIPTGTQAIGGTGEIVFTGAGQGRFLTNGGTTTIGANITIHGTQSGLIDNAANGDQLINLGTINADGAGAIITVNMNGVGALFTNQGHLAANNGGTLTINGNWIDSGLSNEVNSTLNFGGTFTSNFTGLTRTAGTVNITGTLNNTGKTLALNAATGSVVVLGGTILGGAYTATGGATLSTSGSATLDGVTLNSDVTAIGTTTIKNGLTFNNAKFFISNATVIPTGTQAIGGTGEIVFIGAGQGRFLTNGGTTTIGANITIHGTQSGLIDNAANGDQLINLGTINCDTSGAIITINMNGVGVLFTNQGHLAANNGGTLTINGNWIDSGLSNEVNSTLNFGGTFTSDFTGLTRTGGTVNITGTLTNTGKTLALNAATGSVVLLNGTLLGGSYSATGGAILSVSNGIIDGVTLNSDVTGTGTVTIKNGLTFNNAKFTLSGVTAVPTGTQTIGGTGEIIFAGGAQSRILTNGGTTTLGAGITVHGTQNGLIDNNQNGDQFINLGTIKADTSSAIITINMNGTSALFTNQGHLAALNGGTMTVNGNWTDSGLTNEVNSTFNFGGTFTSDFTGLTRTGGTVNITGTLTNTGKTLALNATTGSMVVLGGTILGGAFTATGGATLSVNGGTLDGVTLNSDVTATGNTTIKDGLTFNNTKLIIAGVLAIPTGTQTIGGTGEIVFGGSASGRILTNGGTITIGANVLIHGTQNATIDNAANGDQFINLGTIKADAAGTTITINMNGPGSLFTNQGLLAATNGGTLTINGNWTDSGSTNEVNSTLNFGGTFTSDFTGLTRTAGTVNITGTLTNTGKTLALNATAGSMVLLGGTIIGGTFSATGGATLSVSGGTLDGVTLNSDVAAISTITIKDGLTFNGSKLVLNNVTAILTGTQTIGGTGEIVFGGSSSSIILVNGGTVTLEAGITVHGTQSGFINNNQSSDQLLNLGTIKADTAATTVTVNMSNFTNQGTLFALNGGTLTLNGNWTDSGTTNEVNSTLNFGGTFTSDFTGLTRAGGTVNITGTLTNTGKTFALTATTGSMILFGGTLLGGHFSATGGATLSSNGGTLDGVTLDSDITLTGNSTIKDGLTFNNTKLIISGIAAIITGTQTFGGTGEIIFGGANAGQILTNGSTLTIGSGVTIHGTQSGLIDNNQGSDTVVNLGTIRADTAGTTLTISLNGGSALFTNQGLLAASNGGTLTLGGNWTNSGSTNEVNSTLNFGGTFTSDFTGLTRTGGTVNITGTLTNTGKTLALNAATGSMILFGGTILGGAYSAIGGATLSVSNGTLDGVTLNADVTATSTVTIRDGLTFNNAKLIISNSTAIPTGTQTFSGTGEIVFGGGGTGTLMTNGGTLTLGAGITLHGTQSGNIINNQNGDQIINLGTIKADTAASAIFLSLSGILSKFTNNGTMSALDGATLTINGQFDAGSGILSSATTGSININTSVFGTTIDSTGFNPQGVTTLNANATAGNPQFLEAMGQDFGNVPQGFSENFAYGTLSIGNSNVVKLVDQSNNAQDAGPDAVYVNTLIVPANSTLDLNGLHLYAKAAQITGTVVNGTVFTEAPGTWDGGGDGTNWSDPLNWSGDVLPGAADDVVITIPATINFTSAAGSVTVKSITSSNAFNVTGGTLAVTGAATFSKPLTVTGGALKGGTWNASGTTLKLQGGTLDGVTLASDATMPRGVTIKNGLTLNSANLTITGGAADFLNTQTIGGTGEIIFGGSSAGTLIIDGGTLTIGAGVTVHGTQSGEFVNGPDGGNLINLGTIRADSGGIFVFTFTFPDRDTFTNHGVLQASAGGTIGFDSAFVASDGILTSAASGVFDLDGNLLPTTQDAAGYDPKGTTLLSGTGTTNAPQLFEAMSPDLGNVSEGFTGKFTNGTLFVAANNVVKLVDQAVNSGAAGAEAVYVNLLVVPAGSTLDLNGLNLYAANVQVNGVVINGTINGVPLVTTSTVGVGGAKSVKYTDNDGTLVTVTQKLGTATVQFAGTNLQIQHTTKGDIVTGTNITIDTVTLTNTTVKSTLTIAAKGGNKFADVGAIHSDTAVGSIAAAGVDLVGAGITFTGAATLTTLKLHDVLNGADVIVPGGGLLTGTALTAAHIAAGTDVNVGTGLKSLAVSDWLGGTLTAPFVSKLTTAAVPLRAITGDFRADLSLSGVGAPKLITLGSAKIAGALASGDSESPATWNITGNSGAIAAGNADGWFLALNSKLASLKLGRVTDADLNVPGGIGAISAVEWLAGSITSSTIKSLAITGNKKISVTGDFGAAITLAGNADPSVGLTLGATKIAGAITGAQWKVTAGNIGAVAAASAASGWSIAAAGSSIASLSTLGNLASTINANRIVTFSVKGDLIGAQINLQQPDDPKLTAIGSMTVTGQMLNSTLRSVGTIGAAKLGAMRQSTFFAGMPDAFNGLPIDKSDFGFSDATIKSLTITGIKNDASPAFEGSEIAAPIVGTINLLNVATTHTATHFGVAAKEFTAISFVKDGAKKLVKTLDDLVVLDLPANGDDFDVRIV